MSYKYHSYNKRRPGVFYLKTKASYALRRTDNGQYWDGSLCPPTLRGGRNGKAKTVPKWSPTFTTMEKGWWNKAPAVNAYREYRLYSSYLEKPLPELELVTIQIAPTVMKAENLALCPKMREYDRLFKDYGSTLAEAFDSLKIEPEQAETFRFVIRRKGRSKAIMDESDINGAASYGVYTFVPSDNEALHIKLLLGDNFDRMWQIR